MFCIICGPLGGVDWLWNVALFVPLGAALVAGGTPPLAAFLVSAAGSLAIEAAQWRLITGRDANLGDLVANGLGGALGALAVHFRASIVQPSPRTARRLLVAWSVVLAAVAFAAAWIARPAEPEYVYWSQWAPVRGGFVPFAGSLRALTLFGAELPPGTPVDPVQQPARYRAGDLDVAAVVVPAPSVRGVALIARAGNPLGEQFQIAQRGQDLVVRGRMNAARWSLRSPSFRLAGGLVASGGDPRVVLMRVQPQVVLLASSGARDTLTARARVTLGRAWQSVAPFEVTDVRWDWLMIPLWVALLLVPLGYWATTAAGRFPRYPTPEPRPSPLAPAAVVVIVALVFLGLAPRATGISTGGILEGVGVLVGVLSGAGLRLVVHPASDS